MDHIIKKGIESCFAEGVWRRVAWSVLSSENSEKCQSLQWMTLKSIMSKKMKNGFYENTLFSLIFDEAAPSLRHFMSPQWYENWPETFVQKWKRRLKFWRKKKKKTVVEPRPSPEIIQNLKEDHQIMFAILKNQKRISTAFYMKVIICKTFVKIKIEQDLITIAPHSSDKEYDTYWASKFLELALSQGLISVMVYMKGEGSYDHNYMRAFINSLIDSIPRVIPQQGWRAEIEGGRRNVYMRTRDLLYDDEQTYAAQFMVANGFDSRDLNLYWGYVA